MVQTPSGPDLTVDSRPFACGYGPRAIRLSHDHTLLFVGCKDGSVSAINLQAAQDGSAQAVKEICPPRKAGVRSLCELGNGWLLLGEDGGGLQMVKFQGERQLVDLANLLPRRCGTVGYVGRWDSDSHLFVVSPRRADAVLLEVQPDGEPRPFGRLRGVQAMSGFARIGEDERWIVGKTGALWSWRSGEIASLDHAWDEAGLERPSFVFDSTVVRDPSSRWDEGIFLSTDLGVFLLRPVAESSAAPAAVALSPVYLTGISDLCLAIAHAVQAPRQAVPDGQEADSFRFLWVSDTVGHVHLFWSERSSPPERQIWHRSGLLERRFPVMRALASWFPDRYEAVVAQACRDDRIIISWYQRLEKSEIEKPSADLDLSEVLASCRVEDLRDRLPAGDARRDWSTEALVADFLEDLEDAEAEEALRRFLRNPGLGLTLAALADILRDGPPERSAQALTLWTHTLLGTVHRRLRTPSTQDYLGILRWLRRIDSSPQLVQLLASHRDAETSLRASLDLNIQYARKWGVFGHGYAAREKVLPTLAAFRQQETPDRRFDRLVYESLVFRRRMDLYEKLDDPAVEGRLPSDLEYLAVQEGDEPAATEYMALSSDEGGTVYRRGTGASQWRELPLAEPPPPPAPPPAERPRGPGGRILLCTCSTGQPYLLSSPVPASADSQEPRELLLHAITPTALPAVPVASLQVARFVAAEDAVLEELPEDKRLEEVYSLLALPAGRVAVGLQGTDKSARFGLLRIADDGQLHRLRPEGEMPQFRAIYPESKMQLRNPVWCLAQHSPSETETILFLGCTDGQIWEARLHFLGDDQYRVDAPALVGRLSARVTALACRVAPGAAGARVFAGGADGTLIAFQEIGGRQEGTPTYATLWATFEQGPVQRLHLLESALAAGREDRDGTARQIVLAVTQQGVVVPILDRTEVERLGGPTTELSLHRLKVPGERLGRISVGSSSFGSALVAGGTDGGTDPVLARLAIAPAAGGPRIVHLCFPKYTQFRRSFFSALLQDWLASLHEEDAEIQSWLLRRPETTYVVAPELAASLVRWILPTEPGRETREAIERNRKPEKTWADWSSEQEAHPDPRRRDVRQWLPRHLRPLAELEAAWRGGRSLRGLFKTALQTARDIEDRALFREILETVLSRANHQLFSEAREDGKRGFGRQFLDLVWDLNEVKGVWAGSEENLDMRMRMVVAKSLLDGDTLWSLSGAVGASPKEDGPLAEAMRGRIRLIHRFLGEGDLLLALETLRAANLALLRVCRRLARSTDDPSQWSSEQGVSQLHWDSISGFFEAVGDFAARLAHPKATLGEVAAHEICRSFALGMLACPSSIVRLAIWMAEADLPLDISERVEEQLDLLAALLGEDFPALSEDHRRLLQITLHAPRPGVEYRSVLFFRPRPAVKGWAVQRRKFGEDNAEMTRSRMPFDLILIWLHELARQLTEDAGSIDLEAIEKRRRALDRRLDETNDQFRHSRKLWREALKDLAKCAAEYKDLQTGTALQSRHVRPDLVLFSSSLAEWSKGLRVQIQKLRTEYQIFEPMSSLCDEALALVERAAERFQRGAALQKNLVLGVMGHGLLELLDEHLLEVWEVALTLDPRRTWHQDLDEEAQRAASPSRVTSTAGRFAEYLLQRSHRAEMIPKNLRSLQGLLSFPEHSSNAEIPLADLLGDFAQNWDWQLGALCNTKVNQRTFHFLHLTLSELAQNDQIHGRKRGNPVVSRDPVKPENFPYLELRFFYPAEDKEAFKRVREQLFDKHLQEMVDACEDPSVPSHGSGLYLANLAAAAVGWKLDLLAPQEPGKLVFVLWQGGRNQ